MIDHFSSPTPLTTLTVSEYRVKHMCIAFIHRSRRETRPSPRFGHGCEERKRRGERSHPPSTTHGQNTPRVPPHTSKWCASLFAPISHTDWVRKTHTTGPRTHRPRHHHRPVPTRQSGALAHPGLGLASSRSSAARSASVRRATTHDGAGEERCARRDDDAMIIILVVRASRMTDARAREERERDTPGAREREREGFATDDPIATQTTR